jgi:uncharacterized protein YkwD
LLISRENAIIKRIQTLAIPLFAHSFLASALTSLALTGQVSGDVTRPVQFPSRADVVMQLVLARTQNVPIIKNTGAFPDIEKFSWYEPYMLFAERMGIVRAEINTNLLYPNKSVTRAEFLKMFSVTFGIKPGYPHVYRDIPKNAWFDVYAGVAHSYGLFTLENPYYLEPQRAVTQREVTHALAVYEKLRKAASEPVALEQEMAQEQADGKLTLYNVISTRKQNVTLVDPEPAMQLKPLVRKIPLPQSLPDIRSQIVTLVNEIRSEHQLPLLTENPALDGSAQFYAEKMAAEGFFGHVAPNGQTLKDRIAATTFYQRGFSMDCFCIKGYALGENLARGQKTSREVVDAWMKSPSHRDAILNPAYSYIGIGAKAGYWVQHFGGIILPPTL